MKQQSTIPFIGGYKDGHRVTPDEYPQPWVRFIERPAIDFTNVAFDPSTPPTFKEHVYEGHRDACGRMFYAPMNSDPKEAVAAALDKYPPPADPTKIAVPVKMFEALLRGDPDAWTQLAASDLLMEHYRNCPPE